MKVYAEQFKTFNMKGCVERADDLLLAMQEMRLSNEQCKNLCREMGHKVDNDGDVWESLAWQMAYVEMFERQVRVEDPQCETPPAGYNGGFSELLTNEPSTYRIQINEAQRGLLHRLISYIARDDMAQKLFIDLGNLPEDSKHMSIVNLIDD